MVVGWNEDSSSGVPATWKDYSVYALYLTIAATSCERGNL